MPQAGRRLHATRKTAAGKAFCKRWQNALQKAIFHNAKGRLSENGQLTAGLQSGSDCLPFMYEHVENKVQGDIRCHVNYEHSCVACHLQKQAV